MDKNGHFEKKWVALNARFLYEKFKNFPHPSMSDEIGEVFALNNINKIISAHGFCLLLPTFYDINTSFNDNDLDLI